jgi:hypothetical protein
MLDGQDPPFHSADPSRPRLDPLPHAFNLYVMTGCELVGAMHSLVIVKRHSSWFRH